MACIKDQISANARLQIKAKDIAQSLVLASRLQEIVINSAVILCAVFIFVLKEDPDIHSFISMDTGNGRGLITL